MLFLYLSSVYLTELKKDLSLGYDKSSGDILVPMSLYKFKRVCKLISSETVTNKDITSLNHIFEGLEALVLENKDIKITMECENLDNNESTINESNVSKNEQLTIDMSIESRDAIIDTLNRTNFYYLMDGDNCLDIKEITEFLIIFYLNSKDNEKKDYSTFTIPTKEYKNNCKKLYNRFTEDLELFKLGKIEEIVMKKTFANCLALALESTDCDPFESNLRKKVKYSLNGKSIETNLYCSMKVATFNLYFFAFIYNEIE